MIFIAAIVTASILALVIHRAIAEDLRIERQRSVCLECEGRGCRFCALTGVPQ